MIIVRMNGIFTVCDELNRFLCMIVIQETMFYYCRCEYCAKMKS